MSKSKLKGSELAEFEERLAKYAGDDRIISSKELEEELKKTQESIFTVPTNVPTLDRLQGGGFEPGELILVTGPTGEGKTTLLMSITQNMALRDINTVWFTLEVTPRQFLKKISKGGATPLFYLPREKPDESTLSWLKDRIIEAKTKYNCKVVFIDHIHQIFSLAVMNNQNRNLSWEIGDLAAKIKDIAVQHNIIIFLIAHMKDDPTGSSREPRKEDVRDSGLIIRYADSVIGVWRVPNDEELSTTRRKAIDEEDIKAKIRLFKNRREGTLGSWFMYHTNHHLEEQTKGFSNEHF